MKKLLSLILIISMVSILAACGGSSDPQVFKSQDSLFQVEATTDWKDAGTQLNPAGNLQIYNPQKEKYLLAITESKKDFGGEFTLQQYYDAVTQPFLSTLADAKQGDIKEVTINGNKGMQYKLEGSMDGIKVTYLVTLVETPTHYAQLLIWSLSSKYDKYQEEYTKIINSFKHVA